MTSRVHPSPLAAALAIARRDLLEFVRDRRTLVITLLLPMVTYPILALATALGLRTAMQEIDARTAPGEVRLGLSGAEAESLATLVRHTFAETPARGRDGWPADVALADVSADQAGGLLDDGAIDFWIDAPEGLLAGLESADTVRLPIRVSATNPPSSALRDQFLAFVRSLARDFARRRLARAGLPTTLLEPMNVVFEGEEGAVPPPSQNILSTLSGGVLVLLTVLTLTGAFYPAIDAIAGEKERGTIETLLIAPCRITDVVFGKFLGVFAVTLATLVANLVSIAATAAVSVRYLPGGLAATLPEGSIAVAGGATLLAFIGMAALAAATCLAVTTASKSGKEAQNTLTPVILLVSAIAGTALLPGLGNGLPLAAVPFAGQIAVARAALGTATDPAASPAMVTAVVVVSLLSSGLVTWLLLQLTSITLADEEVLFRGPDVAGMPFHRPGRRLRPGVAQACIPLLAGFAGLWYSQGIVPGDLRWAIPIQQATAVLAPLALMLAWQRVDLRDTFSLRWPARAGLVALGAMLLGAGLFMIGAAILLNVRSAGLSPEARQLSARLIALVEQGPWWLAWALIAVVPALCEELLFRGWMLAGLSGPKPAFRRTCAAVVIQAAAFAAFHLLPERMPQTFLLGLALGWIVVRSRSLAAAVLCHCAHNSVPLVILATAGDATGLAATIRNGGDAATPLPGWVVAAAAAAVVVGTGLIVTATRNTYEEQPT